MEYAWKQAPSLFHKVDPQKVGEEIGNAPTPESVLEKAKDPNTELHGCFEWDDTKAANKYRLIQARQIIQFLVIKGTEKTDTPQRAFEITRETSVYAPVQLIVRNEDEYSALLAKAKAQLKQFADRYRRLSELEAVIEEIDNL